MAISFEDAKALLEKGQISSKTFDSLTGVKWEKKAAGGIAAAAVEGAKALVDKLPSVGGTAQGINESGTSTQDVRVETAKTVDDELMKQRKTTIEQTGKAREAIENVGEKTQELMDPFVNKAEGEIGKLREDIVKNDELMAKELTLSQENQQAAMKDLQDKSLKVKINPDRFMQDLTGSDKVMSTIGIALSGMGSGLTGQPNMAMQTLQTRIQRDIDAQAKDYENAFNKAKIQSGVASQQMAGAQTRAMAKNVSTITTIAGYKAGLENVMSKITSQTAKDKAQMLIQQLDQMQQTKLLEVEQLFKTNISAGDAQSGKLMLDLVRNKVNGRPLLQETGAKDIITKGAGVNVQKQPTEQVQPEPAKEEVKKEEPKKKESLIEALTKRGR